MDVGADNFRFNLDTQNGLKNPVQIIRQPATTELHLDSLDRYLPSMLQTNAFFQTFPDQNVAKLCGPILLNSSQSGTRTLIQTSRPLTYGYYSRVALTQFYLKYQVPTISLGYNIGFFLETGTSPGVSTATRAIGIAPGYYRYVDLALAIQNAMRAYPELAAATCVYSTVPARGFVFNTGNAGVYMAVLFGVPPGTTELGQIVAARCGRTLGFNRALYGLTPAANTGGQPTTNNVLWNTATGGPPNLLPTDYVDIVSTSLTNYKDAKDGNTSVASPVAVLGRIWLTEGTVNVSSAPEDAQAIGSAPISVIKSWQNPNWCQWSPNQTINAIDITLLDMWGNVVAWDSTYGTEWSATLTLTE